MATVIALDDIRLSETAALFEGGADVPVSIFVTQYEPGRRVAQHLHPYPEVFVVHAGTARFTIGGEDTIVAAGNIVIVPEQTAHGFACEGDATLRVMSVHPSPKVEQVNLET